MFIKKNGYKIISDRAHFSFSYLINGIILREFTYRLNERRYNYELERNL